MQTNENFKLFKALGEPLPSAGGQWETVLLRWSRLTIVYKTLLVNNVDSERSSRVTCIVEQQLASNDLWQVNACEE